MIGSRSSGLNQNKQFSIPVSTLMSSSAKFYSFSLSGRLRAVGLNALLVKLQLFIYHKINNIIMCITSTQRHVLTDKQF